MDRYNLAKTLAVAGLPALAALGAAQGAPTNPQNGILHFQSNIGSFKLFNGDGDVKFHFKGTVLIRGFKGTVGTTGTIAKQYDSHGRQAYFGEGEFSFNGHFDSIQWFGQNLNGEWNGRGGFRVYGDYDKNLQTGWFWFNSDEAHRTAWPTQSGNYYLPQKVFSATPTLKPKGSG